MREMEKSPFEILGVPPNAEMREVERAYRKLAMRWHPDRNLGDKFAEEKFKEIRRAYESVRDGNFLRPGYSIWSSASAREKAAKRHPPTAKSEESSAKESAQNHAPEFAERWETGNWTQDMPWLSILASAIGVAVWIAVGGGAGFALFAMAAGVSHIVYKRAESSPPMAALEAFFKAGVRAIWTLLLAYGVWLMARELFPSFGRAADEFAALTWPRLAGGVATIFAAALLAKYHRKFGLGKFWLMLWAFGILLLWILLL